MRSVVYIAIFSILSMMLSACATNLLYSHRAPGAKLGTIQGVRVVFEDAPFRLSPNSADIATALRIKALFREDHLLLKSSIIKTLPAVLVKHKIPASSRSLPKRLMPPNQDFSAFFPQAQRMWHTLIVTPIDISAICDMGCNTYVRTSLRLIDPRSAHTVWSAVVEQPLFDLPGSQQALYNRYARDMAKMLLGEIHKAKAN